MRRSATIVATVLAFAMATAGESLALPVPAPATAMWMDAGTLLTPVAARRRMRKLIRKRKQLPEQHKPPQTQQEKPQTTPDTKPQTTPGNKPDKKPGKTPRHRPKHRQPVVLKHRPAPICIDGRLSGRSCLCGDGGPATRLARGVLQCVASSAAGGSSATRAKSPAGTAATVKPGNAAPGTIKGQIARPQAVADEILVTVETAATPAIEAAIAQRYGLQRLEAWPISLISQRIVRYRIPDGRPVAAVLAAMQGDPQLIASQPNHLYAREAKAVSTQPASLQYAFAKLKIAEAHELSRGRGTVIAVIDSGIDQTHPDLAGRVAETFAATGDAKGVLLDPHGTEIGGIIAARGAINGVAPEASLLDVRVFDYDDGSETLASSMAVLRGLDWASARKAKVINMSLSGPADTLLQQAISALVRKGTVVVAAAGNGGAEAPAAFPAAYDDVIGVTATDSSDGLYAEANHGAYIDVAAPGVDVLSPSLGSAYSLPSGTSFAAAHVSGVVALMLSRDPAMTPDGVRRALQAGAADLGKPGVDPEFGAGLVNALKALRQ